MNATATEDPGTSAGDDEPPSRPSRALLAVEVPRAIGAFALLASVRPLLAAAPSGDGHPVVVLPGFTAGDGSTRYLRRFLRAKGYYVHGWRLGANLGPTHRIVSGLEDRLDAVNQQHGQACSVIGWSLGGNFARQIAKDRPSEVRQVITLGTPLRLDSIDQVAAGPLFNALSSRYDAEAVAAQDLSGSVKALPVPSTSIYSRSDGFVPWQNCCPPPGLEQEGVEVVAGHLALGHHPTVLAVIAERLAQPEGTWAAFADTAMARALRRTGTLC